MNQTLNPLSTEPQHSPIPLYIRRLSEKHAFQIESVISVLACFIFLLGHSVWTGYFGFVGIIARGFSALGGGSSSTLDWLTSYATYDAVIAFLEIFIFVWFIVACVKSFKTKPLPSKSRFYIVNIFVHFLHLVLYLFADTVLALFLNEITNNVKSSSPGKNNSSPWVLVHLLRVACSLGFLGTLWWILSFVLSVLQYDFWTPNHAVASAETSSVPPELAVNHAANVPMVGGVQHEAYISIHEEEEEPSREMQNELAFVDMNPSMEYTATSQQEEDDDRPKMSA